MKLISFTVAAMKSLYIASLYKFILIFGCTHDLLLINYIALCRFIAVIGVLPLIFLVPYIDRLYIVWIKQIVHSAYYFKTFCCSC